jgi:hypothetical protein
MSFSREIREKILIGIETDKRLNNLAARLLAELDKSNGKKFTARLLPKLCKLTGGDVRFTNSFSLQKIYIRDDAFSLLIGYGDGTPIIDTEWIRSNNPCYFEAAQNRIREREETLETWPTQIDVLARRYEQARVDFSKALGSHPDRYRVLEITGQTNQGL